MGKCTDAAIKKAREKNDFWEDSSAVLANQKNAVLEFYNVNVQQKVKYKAFLTQYEDKYESSWESAEVYGRMDPIQTFKGTKRSISLGWDVIASSVGEAYHNLTKTEQLLKMLYPQYDSHGGATSIAAAPLVKLKFGNLIMDAAAGDAGATVEDGGLLGTISGFSYAPDIEQGFFDVDNKNTLYPQTIKLSCVFTVLHTHDLGWRPTSTSGPAKPGDAPASKRPPGWDAFPYINPDSPAPALPPPAASSARPPPPNISAAAANQIGGTPPGGGGSPGANVVTTGRTGSPAMAAQQRAAAAGLGRKN
jgi:hypothetical protein